MNLVVKLAVNIKGEFSPFLHHHGLSNPDNCNKKPPSHVLVDLTVSLDNPSVSWIIRSRECATFW